MSSSKLHVNRIDVSGGIGVQQNFYGSTPSRPEHPRLVWRTLPDPPDAFSLLDWHYRVTDLIGRDAELEDLRHWAHTGEAIRIRFLSGEGGVGKTRLAAQFADELRQEHWQAGFVRLDGNPISCGDEPGRLLIIDYPEDRRERIRELFEQLSALETSSTPLRLLLLSRNRLSDWQPLIDQSAAALLCDAREIAMSPLTPSNAIRLCHSFWNQLQALRPELHPPHLADAALQSWLEQDPQLHGRPLFLAAAALHAAENPGQAFELAGAEIIRALVRRECLRLNQLKFAGFQSGALSRLAALASVGNGLAPEAIRALADPSLELGLPAAHNAIAPLKDLPWWRNQRFTALQPDILAAALIHQVFTQVREDPLVSEWLWHALRFALPDITPQALVSRLDRLDYDMRMVYGWENNSFPTWLSGTLRGTQPNATLDRAQTLGGFSYAEHVSLGARGLCIEVTKTLLEDSSLDDLNRALLLNNLGARLSEMGQREEALVMTEEAVGKYRKLSAANPTASLPNLAASLSNLGLMLSALGRQQAALEATEEAVEKYREVLKTNPAHLPGFATSLNNLGKIRSELGRREAALTATEQAVQIRRQLSDSNRSRYLPALATSLSNLGNMLKALGRNQEALVAAEEAVKTYRELSVTNPGVFLSTLAMCLSNWGNILSALAQGEEALKVTEEAVDIYRRLSESNSNAFRSDLAMGLNNLSIRLYEQRRTTEALSPVTEAVDIYRQLSTAQPKVFRHYFAESLNNLGGMLYEEGRNEEALEYAEQAVRIRRELLKMDPSMFLKDLASSLNNLGRILSGLGRQNEARDAADESTRHYTTLCEALPAAFAQDLERAARNLAKRLQELELPLEENPTLIKATALLTSLKPPSASSDE